MSSDADGVVGKIKTKAKDFFGAEGDGPGDADPDVEYEPTPDQTVLHDGMVVLSESQSENVDGEDVGSGSEAVHADESGGSGPTDEGEASSG